MTTTVFKGDSPPITSMDDLLAHFRSGEKPRERWRIGTEHEKIPFYRSTHQPVPYEGERGIGAMLDLFHTRFGWSPVREGGNVIALTRGQASITLEPGGQLELSGAPLSTSHETCMELGQHLREVSEISEEMGVAFLNMGRNPSVLSPDMPWMPKERYAIMREYLSGRGTMALDMMLGTATVQVNIDYGDEADMVHKMRAAMGVAPLLTAIYANSPFAGGAPTGYLSTRSRIWEDTDKHRTGFFDGLFSPDFGYRAYVEYALDVPMFFIHRDGHYLNMAGHSFRRFMDEGYQGHIATMEDWELHLTTIFPMVRLKKYIELRMADVGPLGMICAFPALARGLFYDDQALAETGVLASAFCGESTTELTRLESAAAREGLRAQSNGRAFREWARELLDICKGGLQRLGAQDALGEDERGYLHPLEKIVDSGTTLADGLLKRYHGDWGGGIDGAFTTPDTLF